MEPIDQVMRSSPPASAYARLRNDLLRIRSAEVALDRVECGLQARAEALQSYDDAHADNGGDQCIFDGGCARTHRLRNARTSSLVLPQNETDRALPILSIKGSTSSSSNCAKVGSLIKMRFKRG